MYAAGRKKNLFSFQLEIGHKRHVSIISNSETLNMIVDWVGHLFLLRKMLGRDFGEIWTTVSVTKALHLTIDIQHPNKSED